MYIQGQTEDRYKVARGACQMAETPTTAEKEEEGEAYTESQVTHREKSREKEQRVCFTVQYKVGMVCSSSGPRPSRCDGQVI